MRTLLLAIVLVCLSFPLAARAEGVLEACQPEIDALCSKVSPGNGRMIACMYAHENYLSERCANAIADLGDMLDSMFATVRDAVGICAKDIEAQCGDTQFGGGRVLSCLTARSADISVECRAVVERYSAELPPQ